RVRRRRGLVTLRSTSVFASLAVAIRCPSSLGASSRTIVSTSGNSGTRDLPPADVATERLAGEIDLGACGGAFLRGLRDRVTERSGGEHPAAGGSQPTAFTARCPGMEDDHVSAEVGW